MVEVEHSDYLTGEEQLNLTIALTSLGFSPSQIRVMVRAAAQRPAISVHPRDRKRS